MGTAPLLRLPSRGNRLWCHPAPTFLAISVPTSLAFHGKHLCDCTLGAWQAGRAMGFVPLLTDGTC